MARLGEALHGQFLEFAAQKRKEREEARAGKAALAREEMAERERIARPLGEQRLAEAEATRFQTGLAREYDPQFARVALGERRGALREQQEQRRAYLEEEKGLDITPTVTRGGVTTRYSAIGRPLGVGGLAERRGVEVARPAITEPVDRKKPRKRTAFETVRAAVDPFYEFAETPLGYATGIKGLKDIYGAAERYITRPAIRGIGRGLQYLATPVRR